MTIDGERLIRAAVLNRTARRTAMSASSRSFALRQPGPALFTPEFLNKSAMPEVPARPGIPPWVWGLGG